MSDRKPKTDPKKKSAPAPAEKPAKPKKKAAAPVRARSESGKTKNGKPKKLNVPDTNTEVPVTPDKEPTVDHIAQGLAMGLSLKMIEFVEVYLTCYNGSRTYMAVYGQKNRNLASVESCRLLRKPKVMEYVSLRMKAAFDRTESAQDQLIQTYTSLAYGDVNELVEYRRESCRYCHGDGHLYQSTPQEMRDARAAHAKEVADALPGGKDDPRYGAAIAAFDERGGVGFDPSLDPHPECPECHGDGHGHVHFHDTRNLSPAALALYEGAEITKDGIKIRTSSRDGAREKLAKILKIYEDTTKVELTLSAEEMDALFGTRMDSARARADQIRMERGLPSED